MSQVCIPSIHKSTSPTRWLRKSERKQKKWIPSDDFKSRRQVDKLHTIGVIKGEPISISELKEMVNDYYNCNRELPTRYYTSGYYNNRKTIIYSHKFGCVTISYVQSDTKEGLG